MPAGDPRIVGVRALPLLKKGEIANEAFWPTLIEVTTDVGVGGVGTVSNSLAQVESSIELLSELLIGETAQEPMRVTENLHQQTCVLTMPHPPTHSPARGVKLASAGQVLAGAGRQRHAHHLRDRHRPVRSPPLPPTPRCCGR